MRIIYEETKVRQGGIEIQDRARGRVRIDLKDDSPPAGFPVLEPLNAAQVTVETFTI